MSFIQTTRTDDLSRFANVHCMRVVNGSEVAALSLTYDDVQIALFTGENLDVRAREYVQTHGYLAAWSKSWCLGRPASWQ